MKSIAENQTASRPSLRLNTEKLYELRKANGIETEAELARKIGVDPASLYRYTTRGAAPSGSVIARIKMAFPLVSLDDLLTVEVAA